ncbi:MAG: hypothetical protein NDJ72_04525 [Elusimicrobia bacterium]|nr:hypothetical protein [Elusimicrobiota bacterium]
MKRLLAPVLCVLLELPSAAAVVVPRVQTGLTPALGPSLSAPALSAPSFQLSATASLTPSLSAAALLAAPAPVPVSAAPTAASPAPAAFAAHPLLAAPAAPGPVGAAATRAAEAARTALAAAGFAAPSASEKADDAVPARKASHDFAKMFALAREVMKRPEARRFLREVFKEELTLTEEQKKEFALEDGVKDMSESQFMLMLQHNPALWPEVEAFLKAAKKEDKADPDAADTEFEIAMRAKFRELLADQRVADVFRKFNDPLTPMTLELPGGKPGYRNAEVFANHQRVVDGKTVPAGDLKKVLLDFIAGAETEIMFNVFDFDLMDVADALIARAKDGVVVTGGIDKNVIAERPDVKAVFDKLNKTKGITIRAVDSVGLNHQKVMVRDFNDEKKAKALFSSGNFTQSCIGPEGDLKDLPEGKRPKDSVPNANHMLVLDSFLLAQVAANSLTKTLVYGLRGSEYPLDGAYKVLGDDGQWIVISFSPRGGMGDINRDMTRRLITSTKGPLRLLQFAFSSEAVRDAIIERAKIEGKDFDLKTVGDTPFAVRPWSVFLELAGYALDETEGKAKEYVEAAANALREVLGAERYEAIRKNLRVGPRAYKNHVYKPEEGAAIQYNAKIHHKVVISGDYAVLGTSFNFSEVANSNQEQFLLTSDKALVAAMTEVFDGLFALATTSIVEEIVRRNELFKKNEAEDEGGDEQYDHVDQEARRSRKKA